MKSTALIIGNSNGIGLAISKELLSEGWTIVGISRSDSPIKNSYYNHIVSEVQDVDYPEKLRIILEEEDPFDICIYCVGIGELLDFSNMENDVRVVDVNLLGMIKAVSQVIPSMLKNGKGHFIGISSIADELLSDKGPSYHASKAGFSNYIEGLALALKSKPVHITNVRFGFVDTKMAKGNIKPFIMTVDRAAQHLKKCIEYKPARYTAPRVVIPLVKFRKFIFNLKILFQ